MLKQTSDLLIINVEIEAQTFLQRQDLVFAHFGVEQKNVCAQPRYGKKRSFINQQLNENLG